MLFPRHTSNWGTKATLEEEAAWRRQRWSFISPDLSQWELRSTLASKGPSPTHPLRDTMGTQGATMTAMQLSFRRGIDICCPAWNRTERLSARKQTGVERGVGLNHFRWNPACCVDSDGKSGGVQGVPVGCQDTDSRYCQVRIVHRWVE